ncbi:hypothetical protein ACFVHB_32480 [Kitasatospora sp. NPDC127111]|uniref:hypothetical protein n=1 Tax=Kitasatospora sp. NPDC127111 TaxID=3345363 RepID=UPI0036282537
MRSADTPVGTGQGTGQGPGRGGGLPGPDLRRPDGRRLGFALALIGLPPLFHLLSADLLTFLMLWYAAASLIRSRATAFDRLVVSGAALIGWTCALGVVASYWPWGLHPVGLAEATALPLIAIRLGRRPEPAPTTTGRHLPVRARLRRLVPGRDLPVLLSAGLSFAFVLYPVLRRDAVGRLGTVVGAEDLGRHAALYDTILRLGGLTSLRQGEAFDTVTLGLATYPQGSHLTLAVITSFLYDGADHGATLGRLSLFIALFAAVTAALATAVLWAMRRAAGPALRGWRGLALVLPAAAYLVGSELPRMHSRGFLSELFALGLLALLVGLAIRPLNRAPEQVVALATLTVGVSFGHYLLLPAALATVLAWAVVHRRRWLPHRVTVLALGAATAALALFPVYVNHKSAGSADVLTLPGGIGPVGRHFLLPVVVAAFAALLTRGSLANRPRRVALLALTAISALCVGLLSYQISTVGQTSYFYEKLLHQLLVIGLICFAAALLPLFGRRVLAGQWNGAGTDRRGERPTRLRAGVTVAVATGCLLFTVVDNGQPDASPAGWQASEGRTMLRAALARPGVAARIAAIKANSPQDGRAVVSLVGDRAWGELEEDWASAEDNLWLSVLNRDQGRSWRGWEWALHRRSAQDLLNFAASSPVPLRFFVEEHSQLLTDLRALTAGRDHPELAVSVVHWDGDGDLVAEPMKSA